MPITLRIHWQRLARAEGQTCPRCAATRDDVQRAFAILHELLPPLGVQPELEITEIDTSSSRASPADSSRITIAEKTIEEWLGGTGGSGCCSVCGDCGTVEVGGELFKAIPEWLILQAALLASAALLDEATDEALSCCS